MALFIQVSHDIHVKYNPASGAVEGLPPEWVRLLREANISKNEQQLNPQALAQALDFYEHNIKDTAAGTKAKFLKKQSLEDTDDDGPPPPPPPKHANSEQSNVSS